jgi:hypothetical protein
VEAGTPPPLFLAAQRSAEADVRAAFPGMELPADLMGMKVADMSVAELAGAGLTNPQQGVLAPDPFANMLRAQFFRAASQVCAAELIRAEAEHRGVPLSREVCEKIAAQPIISSRLYRARNEADVLEALGRGEAELDALIIKAQLPIVNANAHSAASENAVQALAANLGLSADEVRARMPKQLAELEVSLEQLESVIRGVAQPDLARIPSLYAERVEPFVQNITAAFYAVDELDISPELKAEWKERVLSEPTFADASLLKHAAKLGADVARQYGVGALVHNIGNAGNVIPARCLNIETGGVIGSGHVGKEFYKLDILLKVGLVERTPANDGGMIEIALDGLQPFGKEGFPRIGISQIQAPVAMLAPYDIAKTVTVIEEYGLKDLLV